MTFTARLKRLEREIAPSFSPVGLAERLRAALDSDDDPATPSEAELEQMEKSDNRDAKILARAWRHD